MTKIRKYCMFHYSKDSFIFIKIFFNNEYGNWFRFSKSRPFKGNKHRQSYSTSFRIQLYLKVGILLCKELNLPNELGIKTKFIKRECFPAIKYCLFLNIFLSMWRFSAHSIRIPIRILAWIRHMSFPKNFKSDVFLMLRPRVKLQKEKNFIQFNFFIFLMLFKKIVECNINLEKYTN